MLYQAINSLFTVRPCRSHHSSCPAVLHRVALLPSALTRDRLKYIILKTLRSVARTLRLPLRSPAGFVCPGSPVGLGAWLPARDGPRCRLLPQRARGALRHQLQDLRWWASGGRDDRQRWYVAECWGVFRHRTSPSEMSVGPVQKSPTSARSNRDSMTRTNVWYLERQAILWPQTLWCCIEGLT